MSKAKERPSIPQSVRHKRVLDIAESRPKASLDDIATELPWATADLVEHVLEKYGDPAATDEEAGESSGSGDDEHVSSNGTAASDDVESDAPESPSQEQATSNGHDMGEAVTTEQPTSSSDAANADGEAQPTVCVDELSEKQLETLELIGANPSLTQRELAARLDVSAATICTRLNRIDGFDWGEREAFLDHLPDDAVVSRDAIEEDQPLTNDHLVDIAERLGTIEDRLDADDEPSVFSDVEFAHKVIHACMSSELFTEEDELRLLQGIIK